MTIRITIKRVYNSTILTWNVDEKATLKSVVDKLQLEEGHRSIITTLPIVFENKLIEWTNDQTLDSYNITNGSVLTILLSSPTTLFDKDGYLISSHPVHIKY